MGYRRSWIIIEQKYNRYVSLVTHFRFIPQPEISLLTLLCLGVGEPRTHQTVELCDTRDDYCALNE